MNTNFMEDDHRLYRHMPVGALARLLKYRHCCVTALLGSNSTTATQTEVVQPLLQ